MSYEYDIFISYKRKQIWSTWIDEIFLEDFIDLLEEELCRKVKVFVDRKNVKTGTRWDLSIVKSLFDSRILLPLWSGEYFSSKWCKFELAHMLARQELCGFAKNPNSQCLIVPANIRIRDRQKIPECVRVLKPKELNEFANCRIADKSSRREELYKAVDDWVPDIAEAINAAPEHNSKWENLLEDNPAVAKFLVDLGSQKTKQDKLIGFD
ncbi:MAG: TIR domain-containing protein [Leptolyngbyaceae cyanobacterium]